MTLFVKRGYDVQGYRLQDNELEMVPTGWIQDYVATKNGKVLAVVYYPISKTLDVIPIHELIVERHD